MPITKSAKKAMKASERKRVFNLRRKDAMKAKIKEFRALVTGKKTDEARKLLPEMFAAIDKAVKRGVIKKGNAARKKSRLSHSIVS